MTSVSSRFIFKLALALFGIGIACSTSSAIDAAADRTYPAIFMAWNADFNHNHAAISEMSKYDLLILSPQQMGLGRVDGGEKLNPKVVANALRKRQALARLNPRALALAEIRYYDAWEGYLQPESPRWRRDKAGKRIVSGGLIDGAPHVYLIDFSRPDVQNSVAAQCKTYVETGVFDGCFFDWWNPAYSDVPGAEGSERLALIRQVRAAVGDKAILIGNVNGTLPKMTAQYLNGVYMEGFGADGFVDWRRAASNLVWLEAHLRKPAFTALEAWYDCHQCAGALAELQAEGRGQLALMREVTTLSLTHSDGYVLFADPDALPTPDHLHDWYPFWDKSLGRPRGPKAVRIAGGSYVRAFDNGCVVFNPPDNHTVFLTFREPHRSQAHGVIAATQKVERGDGDIFLVEPATERNPCALTP